MLMKARAQLIDAATAPVMDIEAVSRPEKRPANCRQVAGRIARCSCTAAGPPKVEVSTPLDAQ